MVQGQKILNISTFFSLKKKCILLPFWKIFCIHNTHVCTYFQFSCRTNNFCVHFNTHVHILRYMYIFLHNNIFYLCSCATSCYLRNFHIKYLKTHNCSTENIKMLLHYSCITWINKGALAYNNACVIFIWSKAICDMENQFDLFYFAERASAF